MNLVQASDTIISFCAEYGIKPRTVWTRLAPEMPEVTIIVTGKSGDGAAISEELFWTTGSNGLTTARIIFDGMRIAVEIFEEAGA